MEADRKLLNPFFEGYKLSFDKVIVDYFPLKWKCKNKGTGDGEENVEFQVLAEGIYENKLKKSGDKFYYLDEEGNLISFSKDGNKLIKGRFECFGVTRDDEIIFAKKNSGDFVIIKNFEIIPVPIQLDGNNFKVLEVKVIESSIHVILQQLKRVENMKNGEKYEKLMDKTAFSFYKVVIGNEGSSCELIGWSLSRPLVSFIRSTGDVILGSSTGIITEDSSVNTDEPVSDVKTLPKECPDEDNEEDDDNSNDCRITEFNSLDKFQYPEVTISGSSVNDLQVAIKY